MHQETFGEYLRKTRNEHQHGVRAAGKALGTGASHISQVENGIHIHVTPEFIIKCHAVYNMDYTRMMEAFRETIRIGILPPLSQR